MDKAKVEELKKLLLVEKQRILNHMESYDKDLVVSSEDLSEEGDLANSLIYQNISVEMKSRDHAKLRAITEALIKIENNEFGHCEECGDEISFKRLSHNPAAKLCIIHAEEKEKELKYSKSA